MSACRCHLIDYPANPPWDRCIACNAQMDMLGRQERQMRETQRSIDRMAETLAQATERRR